MGLIQEEENKRYFVQLALNSGKDFLSQQTQYIHDKDAIPFYENICYVLALASSKQKENAEKAQELLHRLLKFQVKNSSFCEGAFPKYLHQYPYAKANLFQVDLYRLLKELEHHHALALGSVLVHQLQQALKDFEQYLQSHDLLKKVEKREGLYSSKELATSLLPLRYIGESVLKEELCKYASYWNPSLMCYSGPCIDEYYEKKQVQISSFDYLMSSYYHVYPSSFKQKNLLQLQGALIPYISEVGENVYQEIEGEHQGMPFSVINKERSSLFFFKAFDLKKIDLSRGISKGLHLFRYLWKQEDTLHHLVCQSTHLKIDADVVEEQITILFTYPEQISEECYNQEELELFVDHHKDLSWKIGDKKATVFSLGDKIYLHSPDRLFELVFSIEEGKGDIIGHLSLGNRPSQMDPKASKEFEAFDWRLCLRTLRRSFPFKIKLQMKILQTISLNAYSQRLDCQEKLPLHAAHCQHTESLL